MLVSLDAPYVDTSAADLSLALGGPELPALHVLDLDLPDGRWLRLRLLGASHQVLLRQTGPDGPTVVAETVACLPGRHPDLPEQARDATLGYTFTASVRQTDAGELRREVAALRAELADDPYALIGVFPGHPDAVTALVVSREETPGTVRWRTWHAYPQSNELVLTETVVTR